MKIGIRANVKLDTLLNIMNKFLKYLFFILQPTMPIYDYQCTNPECRRMYDQLESSNAPTTQACVDCGGLAERLMSVPAKGRMGKGSSSNSSSESGSNSGSEGHKNPSYKQEPHIKIIGAGVVACPECISTLNNIVRTVKRKIAERN